MRARMINGRVGPMPRCKCGALAVFTASSTYERLNSNGSISRVIGERNLCGRCGLRYAKQYGLEIGPAAQ